MNNRDILNNIYNKIDDSSFSNLYIYTVTGLSKADYYPICIFAINLDEACYQAYLKNDIVRYIVRYMFNHYRGMGHLSGFKNGKLIKNFNSKKYKTQIIECLKRIYMFKIIKASDALLNDKYLDQSAKTKD